MITNLDNELAIERQKLNALLEITNSVNKNYKISDLLDQFENVMRYYIGVSKLAFINNRDDWKCILSFGIDQDCTGFNKTNMLSVTQTTLSEDTNIEKFKEFDLIMPVFHKGKPLSYLLIGGIKEDDMTSFISHHVGFIQTIANVVSVAIETKTLAKELLKKKLKEKDMKLAVLMQKLLLPNNLPSNQYIDISATYLAKEMVSGDYYDFIPINKNEYVFCIADVSGKGMSAAMLMSNFQATLRANVKYNHNNLTIEELLKELNSSVLSAAKGEKFITFFIGYYTEHNRTLKYINAGHNYPILVHKKNVTELNTGCIALGIFEELPSIQVGELTIEPNTVIMCYTDGMVEVENEDNIQFQSERLAQAVVENSYLNMKAMNKALFETIDEYKGSKPYPDDTAVLSLRII
jgi:sigma-B regulation protein RsbU (phosphoserine phosphatase)